MKRKRSDRQSWGTLTSAMALVGMLALFLFVPNSAIGATIVIDDMSVKQGSSASPILTDCDPTGPALQAGVTGAEANLIGAARIIEITHDVGDGPCTKAYVDGDPTDPGWAVANDPNSTGWGRAVWGGSNTDINNYGLTLNLANLVYFNFTYVKADHATTFTFRVYNSATQGSEATITMPGSPTEKTDVHVTKADFIAISGLTTAVDWSTNISRITLRFDEVEDIDIYVREIQAITEEPPGLICTKKFDKSLVDPGDEITATVVILNTGCVATPVKVTDVLDNGLVFKEMVAGYPDPDTVAGQVLTWDSLGPLDPGNSLTLQYVITVTAISQGESLCNDATAEAIDFRGVATNCRACVGTGGTAPTFTQWGMIGFLLVMGAISVWLMRRRSSVS
jgi:uncharacterized repeat protein (TIGR01451 family)